MLVTRALLLTTTMLILALVAPAALANNSTGEHCPPKPKNPSEAELMELLKDAKDRGALFELNKAGRVGYLYGTVHISRMEWAFPGPTVVKALVASEVIALELNISDPNVEKQLAAKIGKPSNGIKLPAQLVTRIEKQAKRLCAPLASLRDKNISSQLRVLRMLDGRLEGMDPEWGVEAVLIGFANQQKKAIISLETIETHARALNNRKLSGEVGIERVRRSLVALETGKARQSMVKVLDAWEAGDLEGVRDSCKHCSAAMLQSSDDRNVGMASEIDKLLDRGKPIFAAVGFFHLTGPKAIQDLLRKKGYTVKRVF